MSVRRKVDRLMRACIDPKSIFGRGRYLFVISHMRSRSTMLTHVLGSNPDISGYGELHQSYRSSIDLLKMRVGLYRDCDDNLNDKYLLDKILHNGYVLDVDFIRRIDAKIIYLVREPVGTLQSYMRLSTMTENDGFLDVDNAASYYCDRLVEMQKYRASFENDSILIDADDLVNDTDKQLRRMTGWLGLDKPLNKQYSIFKKTGVVGAGDPSTNISSGVISETHHKVNYDIPTEVLARCDEAYQQLRRSYE